MKRTMKQKRIDAYMKYMNKLARGTSWISGQIAKEKTKARKQEKDFTCYILDKNKVGEKSVTRKIVA